MEDAGDVSAFDTCISLLLSRRGRKESWVLR